MALALRLPGSSCHLSQLQAFDWGCCVHLADHRDVGAHHPDLTAGNCATEERERGDAVAAESECPLFSSPLPTLPAQMPAGIGEERGLGNWNNFQRMPVFVPKKWESPSPFLRSVQPIYAVAGSLCT